jgi:hypothetical protein
MPFLEEENLSRVRQDADSTFRIHRQNLVAVAMRKRATQFKDADSRSFFEGDSITSVIVE